MKNYQYMVIFANSEEPIVVSLGMKMRGMGYKIMLLSSLVQKLLSIEVMPIYDNDLVKYFFLLGGSKNYFFSNFFVFLLS